MVHWVTLSKFNDLKKSTSFIFEAPLLTFGANALFWEHHLRIPDILLGEIMEACSNKRAICTLNKDVVFPCALMSKEGYYYVLLNKTIIKKTKANLGDVLSVELTPDTSVYGMPICEEFEAVLFDDPEGAHWFEKLTPGKKRSLIHIINKIKNTNLRIQKTFVILSHLKKQNGVLDYKILQEDFKSFSASQKP